MNGAQRLRGANILVVDDHTDLVENLQEILQVEGASVRAAASAAQALVLANSPFDVALVDVRLPDARGPALVPKLRSHDGVQEVLFVTGHASVDDAIEAVKAGAFAYVLKPFDPEELITTVERALERVRLRRRAGSLQTALERSEDALRTMVDTVQALLLVLEADCRITRANQAVAAASGVPVDELVGANWIERLLPVRDQAMARDACQRVIAGDAAVRFESRLVQRTGDGRVSEREIAWRLAALHGREPLRIYASGMDVTEVRQLEKRTRLAEKLAAVGTFSAGLAHEIRNPLNAAGLQLQLLERRIGKLSDDPSLAEPVKMVHHEIDRLSHLVDDFLAFARPTALDVHEVDARRIVEQVASLERPEAEQAQVELVTVIPELPVLVGADAERLKQVVLNLLRNALEAVGPGKRVELLVEADGAGAKIAVRDNGAGIPEEILPRLFEPFFTTKDEGTGLGMSIAHKLVEMHGGHITVHNDDGAVFEIHLPRHPPLL